MVVLGLVGVVGAIGAFSAFSSQTDNPGNTVTAGNVALSDNDGGVAAYSITNGKPGSTAQTCIRVSYTGSLDSDVKIFTPSSIGSLGQYVNLKIEPGTDSSPSYPSCTNFTADGAAIFDNTLNNLPTSYASGVSDYPGSSTKWQTNDVVSYRITATISASAPDGAQGATTGTHTLRWEARNQ
jgi:hypothetical protein